jgi:hypothetical protein
MEVMDWHSKKQITLLTKVRYSPLSIRWVRCAKTTTDEAKYVRGEKQVVH